VIWGQIRGAIGSALIVEFFLVLVTSFLTGDNGTFGAPIPIGSGAGLFGSDPFHGPRGPIAAGLFAVDVVITAVPIFGVVRWGVRGSALAAGLGGIAALILAGTTYVLMASGLLPFAGLPLPIANQPGEHVSLFRLWINCVMLAVGGAIGYSATRLARNSAGD
jgi:hypothetical protein